LEPDNVTPLIGHVRSPWDTAATYNVAGQRDRIKEAAFQTAVSSSSQLRSSIPAVEAWQQIYVPSTERELHEARKPICRYT
jgi:hypothetical protein